MATNLQPVTYAQARSQIQSGDIVFIRNRTGLISRIIQFATKSHYSHVGIAFWLTTGDARRLMMVEAQGGTDRRVLNLSYYENEQLDIVSAPKPWKDVDETALSKLGKVPYGYVEAIYVGIREFLLKYFNVNIPREKFPGEICSEFVAHVYELPESNISPQLLYEELLQQGCEVKIEVRK